MSDAAKPPRFLHLHASFDPRDVELRCARLINAFGREAEHAIVSGDPARRGAAAALDGKAKPSLLPNLIKRRGELWVGTFGGQLENLPATVRAFTGLPEAWHLVVAGDTAEREAALSEARERGVEDRVHLPGQADPAGITALLDMFVPSSPAEQFPVSLVEAMAAGLPVAAPAVGDVSAMVASDNLPFVVAPADEAALGEAMARLAGEPALRAAVGNANRAKARDEFDEAKMAERFRSLYWSALTRRPA